MKMTLEKPRNKAFGGCNWCAEPLSKGEDGDRFTVRIHHYEGKRYCSNHCLEFDNPNAGKEDEAYEKETKQWYQLLLPFDPG
jgi:hypothetical protein